MSTTHVTVCQQDITRRVDDQSPFTELTRQFTASLVDVDPRMSSWSQRSQPSPQTPPRNQPTPAATQLHTSLLQPSATKSSAAASSTYNKEQMWIIAALCAAACTIPAH